MPNPYYDTMTNQMMSDEGGGRKPAAQNNAQGNAAAPGVVKPGVSTDGHNFGGAGGTFGDGHNYGGGGGSFANPPTTNQYNTSTPQTDTGTAARDVQPPNTSTNTTPTNDTPADTTPTTGSGTVGGVGPTTPTTPASNIGGNGAPTANPNGVSYIAYDADGNPYYIGSDRGMEFLNGAQNGSSITGADGSTWTKDANGNVVIVDVNGRTYTIPGASILGQSIQGPSGSVGPIPKEDYFNNGRQYLDQARDAAAQQIQLQKEYAVNQGITELQRAEEDAQQQFQTQRNQVARDEQIGRDNQALYAEARGDKGGIGYAQYAAIQAQAAQNRLAINQQQTKLSTDTARQIADLRAQGEFEAADALLSLTQTYLGQLQQLYENSMAYSLNVDEFNKQLEKWNLEFEAQVASLTGQYNGQPTYAAQQDVAQAALLLLQNGYDIGAEQAAALKAIYGYDETTINAIKMQAQLAAAGVGSGGGGGGGGSKTSTTNIKNDPAMWIYENLGLYASANDIAAALLRMDKSTYGSAMTWDADGDGEPDHEGTLADYYGWKYGNMSDADRVQMMAAAGEELPIDWKSVQNLGQGMLSEDELVRRTADGMVNYQLQNGKLVFYPTVSTQPVSTTSTQSGGTRNIGGAGGKF